MTPDTHASLEDAIRALEALAARRGRPTRHDARALLLELGGCLDSGRRGEAEAARTRIRALPAEFLDSWEAAVRDELMMAATEHVRSVDPQYLRDPAYDFEYTLQARSRLGARLGAAEFLGLSVDETTLSGIARADALLERHKRP